VPFREQDTGPLLNRAKEWLSEQGYPLEMRTAQTFRKAGFEVYQSQLYSDGETGKLREIDLIALTPDHVGVTRITFAIECKSSKKPWILFSSGETLGMDVFSSYSLMNEKARDVFAGIGWDYSPEMLVGQPAAFEKFRWLKKSPNTAFSFRQAFSDTDSSYTALVSTIKAASHLLASGQTSRFPHFRFVFPMIVVDSPLLLCKLEATGEPELTQVDSGEILFTNPNKIEDVTCIRITTVDALPSFLTEAVREVKQIRKEFRPTEVLLWEEEFGRTYPHELADLSMRKYDTKT
jgi:hypothetical protein